MEREECRKFRVCFEATIKKSMSFNSYRPHSLDSNDEEIGEEMLVYWFVLSFILN